MVLEHTGQAVNTSSESDDEEMTDSDMTSSSDDENREPSNGQDIILLYIRAM